MYSARGNDNNNGEPHEHIPVVLHLTPTGEKDEDGRPIPQVDLIDGRDEGDQEAVGRLLNRLSRNSRRVNDPKEGRKFLASQERFHGGYRQSLWALWLMMNGDWDQRKRGGDKLRKYTRILSQSQLGVIEWDLLNSEVYIIYLSRYNEKTDSVEYAGFCVFVEDNENGEDAIRTLEKSVKRRGFVDTRPQRQQWVDDQPVQQVQQVQAQETAMEAAFEDAGYELPCPVGGDECLEEPPPQISL